MTDPRPPAWAKVAAARAALAGLFGRHVGRRLEADVLDDLAVRAAAACGCRAAKPGPVGSVWGALRVLVGLELTPAAVDRLVWRLAGNCHRVRAGRPVPPWPAPPEWAIGQVAEVAAATRQFGKEERFGYRVTFQLLTGPAAGRPVGVFWTAPQVRLRRGEFGFSRRIRQGRNTPRTGYEYVAPVELYRLRAELLVRADAAGKPEAAEVKGRGGTKAWNETILAKRHRRGFACPLGLPLAELPCRYCKKGIDFCPAACRPVTARADEPPPPEEVPS